MMMNLIMLICNVFKESLRQISYVAMMIKIVQLFSVFAMIVIYLLLFNRLFRCRQDDM